MRGQTLLITAVLLWCGLIHALPGVKVKRVFNIDDSKCKRDDDEKKLIKTELGIAMNIAQAAAAATLDSSNKWAKYFFDDETIKTPDEIESYYALLRDVFDDSKYPVGITCPKASGDDDYQWCRNGVWATTFAYAGKRIVICPIWFDGFSGGVKQDSSVVKANCKAGAKGEKNWQIIEQFKGIKSFNLLHEATHLNYATGSDGVPISQSNKSHDYAYDRPNCKKLRDGKQASTKWCSKYKDNVCPADKSFRNADTLAFVASGIYWEGVCDKTIDIEVQSGDPDEVPDPGSDDEDPDGEGISLTSSATAANITPAPTGIGPLVGCTLVQTTVVGTIAPGPATYCQCGDVIAGINTKTAGSLLYDVCAGAPYPTVATSTIAAPPGKTPTGSPATGACSTSIFSEGTCNNSCGAGTCEAASNALGTLYYHCNCP